MRKEMWYFILKFKFFYIPIFLTASAPRPLYQAESIRPSLFLLLGLSATAP